MKRAHWLLASLCILVECSGEPQANTFRDTLTQRQKDSITATLPLPGSRGVGRALETADSVAARTRRLDSIQRNRE